MSIPIYSKLNSQDKIKAKKILIFSLIALFLILGYTFKKNEKNEEQKQIDATEVEEITINKSTDAILFEEGILEEVAEVVGSKDKEIKNLGKQVDDLKEMVKLMALNQNPATNNIDNKTKKLNNQQPFANWKPSQENYPPTSDPTNAEINFNQNKQNISSTNQTTNNTNNEVGEAFTYPPSVWIGGIVHQEYITAKTNKDDTQKQRVIRLAPSFMSAYLLTGMDAMTIEDANDNPEPMMLRVQAPAVLPNDVKAQLEGCFVIAEGYGSLATHRVDARLVSLSCIDYKGQGIIHEQIQGYIQDSDGKRGIKGQPVHRAGSLIARSLIAGGAEGIGNALSTGATTINTSSLGQSTSVDGSNIAIAGVGGAIKSSAKGVKDLFLQLAKQSTPVIEVGAGKKVDVVITKFIKLNIKGF